MTSRGLAYSLPSPSAVVHPQPTTGARHLCQQLRAGRQAQILERACEFTPVMAPHLRKGELLQQDFGFAALIRVISRCISSRLRFACDD